MFILAALVLVSCSMHVFAQPATPACDIPYLCAKMDQQIRTSDNIYSLLQNVESKVDDMDKKVDHIALSTRLHSTMLYVDINNFDVSKIFNERIYLASKTPALFDIKAANAECKSQGGYLLELDDNEERKFTYSFVQSLGGATHFATGGNDIALEGTWVYENSGKAVPADLEWLAGEPNNAGGNEDCMVFWIARQALNDIPCNMNIKYVCEVPLREV